VYASTVAIPLVIGGVEKNSGPGVEAEKMFKFCVADATEILNQEINVTYGCWFHDSCSNVKAQVVENKRWTSNKCRSERLGFLKEEMQDAVIQNDNLTKKNMALEEQLRSVTW